MTTLEFKHPVKECFTYGTNFKRGICREAKIGDLLPPESCGVIQKATIELTNKGAAYVTVTYCPQEKKQ